MAEVGKVVEVLDGKAIVELRQTAACAGCRAVHACFMGYGTMRRATVCDPLGVRMGDRVEVTLQPNALVKASFIVYILPLIALFVGLFLGRHLRSVFEWPLSADVAGILVGFGFLSLAFLFIRLLGPRLERSGDYRLTITGVAPREEAETYPAEVVAGREDR